MLPCPGVLLLFWQQWRAERISAQALAGCVLLVLLLCFSGAKCDGYGH
jgi:hypothetical protein